MSKEVNIKGDQKMSVSVNDYSFSQCSEAPAGGIPESSEPTPESSLPDGLVNPNSLSKSGVSLGKGGDNINSYSLSKQGIAFR